MIAEAGIENRSDGSRHYQFFDHDLFGLDRALDQLVEYFHSAAQRLEVRKRILLLMGPVGGGKSTLVALLKRGLERYTRTASGGTYALVGCPMHEEPLHLIPEALRTDVWRDYQLYIEGDLCPVCRQRLTDIYHGHIDEFPVERLLMSEKERIGIGTFSPSDPKSQDISELTGSIDLATIGEYGSESDPRAYRFDGELNIANRGLMEFIEMLKSDEKFLYGLLTLSQEQNIKTGRFAMIYADEVIVTEEDDRDIDGLKIMEQIASGAVEAGKTRDKDLFLVHDRTEAIEVALNRAKKDDTVLLLGKGHEKTIERADGEHPWDEIGTAETTLKKLRDRLA
jgi:serine protein kinase